MSLEGDPELQMGTQHRLTPWLQPVSPWAEDLVIPCPDFWPAELWNNKWLFQAVKFVESDMQWQKINIAINLQSQDCNLDLSNTRTFDLLHMGT